MHMHILSECQICLPNYKILLSCSVKSQPVLLQVPSFKSWIHFQVLDPPRQRKASVTHDPKRVMCYDQPLRACLG